MTGVQTCALPISSRKNCIPPSKKNKPGLGLRTCDQDAVRFFLEEKNIMQTSQTTNNRQPDSHVIAASMAGHTPGDALRSRETMPSNGLLTAFELLAQTFTFGKGP